MTKPDLYLLTSPYMLGYIHCICHVSPIAVLLSVVWIIAWTLFNHKWSETTSHWRNNTRWNTLTLTRYNHNVPTAFSDSRSDHYDLKGVHHSSRAYLVLSFPRTCFHTTHVLPTCKISQIPSSPLGHSYTRLPRSSPSPILSCRHSPRTSNPHAHLYFPI